MSSKQAKIQELIAMQKKFIEYDREHGVDPQDYYIPKAGDPFLHDYEEKYQDIAMEIMQAAHEEIGSSR
jgi:hypothetical protein